MLYVSNFAWIALNNVIAASAVTRAVGGAGSRFGQAGSETAWAIVLGLIATAIVWRGPRMVARADRLAVPLLLVVATALTIACLHAPEPAAPAPLVAMSWWRGLDVVIGYQVSWILMFADYSRYTRSVRGSAVAVFLGLAITSAWMMPLGAIAAQGRRHQRSGCHDERGWIGRGWRSAPRHRDAHHELRQHLHVGAGVEEPGAWRKGRRGRVVDRDHRHRAQCLPGVWLQQYTSFMVVLGALLVPIGGILVAHYYLQPVQLDDVFIASLYDERGPLRGVLVPGIVAWTAGALAFCRRVDWRHDSGAGGLRHRLPDPELHPPSVKSLNHRRRCRAAAAWRSMHGLERAS